MGLIEVIFERIGHLLAYIRPLLPVVWSNVVSCDVEDTVPGNSSEDCLVVILQQLIHLRKLILLQDVLEGEVQVQLQTLLSSRRQLDLLGVSVIRELNTLVDGWEMNERVKQTNPMESASEHIFLIDVLG